MWETMVDGCEYHWEVHSGSGKPTVLSQKWCQPPLLSVTQAYPSGNVDLRATKGSICERFVGKCCSPEMVSASPWKAAALSMYPVCELKLCRAP